MSTGILFSPTNVASVLADMPAVAALLPDPAFEGQPSEAFPGVLRKTCREVYRWIANTHYPHLAEAVPHLERVHAAGCTFGNLLTTTSREVFMSYTAEVLVADDLLPRGYSVTTVPLLRSVSRHAARERGASTPQTLEEVLADMPSLEEVLADVERPSERRRRGTRAPKQWEEAAAFLAKSAPERWEG